MSYRDYLACTPEPSEKLLADWRWLIGPRLRFWHMTRAGDALLYDPDDASIHFLDVAFGTVERIAENEDAFETALQVRDNADKWLLPALVDGQAALGMCPGENECLSFKHPPALGGTIEPDNFETCDIAVHLSIAGQIHRHVKDLPPGTKITGIDIQEPSRANRPWWRLW